ncbi:hypothetical protein MNBD_GAMMA13-1570, partial [hydrothermal vent metagenome]
MSKTKPPAQSSDYLQTYALKCDPFADSLDGRFFYAGAALMQRLDLITHLIQFSDAIILVSGPQGSGKTTLLGRFAAQANKQWRLCPINADEFEQFPALMASTLAVGEIRDELEMLEYWASETDCSQLLVILIDKTELLPESAIQSLCRLLASPVGERIRLILFGSAESQQLLKITLGSKNLPGSAQLLEVPRLSEEETSSYLMYRLAVAGYSGESPFTATEIRAICKAAEGRPGTINRLAHESLLEHQTRKRSKRVNAKIGKTKFGVTAWASVTLLLIVLSAYFAWQRLQLTPESSVGAPVADIQSIPLAIPDPAPEPEAVALQALMEPAAPNTPSAPVSAPQVKPKTAAPRITMPSNITAEPGAKPATTEATPTPAVIAAPTPAKPTATGAQGPHREAWLLEQPGNRYSLQLLGSRSQKSMLDYIGAHKLEMSESAYYRGQYRGGEWFVLMYGTYPNQQAALAARATLPI